VQKMRSRILVVLAGLLLAGCGVYRERILDVPLGVPERRLVMEMRIELPQESILLHREDGEWFETSNVVVAASGPSYEKVSYVYVPLGNQPLVGGYNLRERRRFGAAEMDMDALRQQAYWLYHKHRMFPEQPGIDLVLWAQEQEGRIAYHELYCGRKAGPEWDFLVPKRGKKK